MSAALATSTPVSPLPAYRQPKRRGSELLLLVLGFGIGTLAYVQVDYAVLGHLDDKTLSVLGVVALLLLIAHSAIRWLAAYADPIMFPLAAALNILGLTMIHRLDLAAAVSAGRNGTAAPRPEAYAQLTWTALGLGLMVIVLLIVRDHRKLQRYTYTSLLGALVLLVLPLAPIVGKSIGGATIWVRVAGYSFQPGELSKILLTIFFAGYLVVKRDSLALVRTRVLGMGFPRGRDLGPIVAAWLFSLGILVFENDFGMSLLFFGLSVLLLYIATQRRSWLAMGFVLFVGGAVAAYLLVSHVRVRFDIWLHPFDYASTTGYQLVQSLYGLASGGIFGSGLGQGYPQLVPFAKSDFIFAAFGEEIGLAGMLALLVIYAIIVERGLRTAVACRDPFGTLLAAGLAIVFGLQTFIVVGGVTRLIPLTGLTTPFLSQGGSSLIANWIAIGLLLRISNSTRRPDPSYKSDDAATQVVRL